MKSKTIFNLITHPNGTKSLVDSENGQSMHSRIGPETEARLVYADRARIEERLVSPEAEVVLYDVGMGTAANALATFERLSEFAVSGRLHLISFELKPEGLETALAHLEDFPLLARWEEKLRSLLSEKRIAFEIGGVSILWELRLGDFYSLLSGVPPADFIYFDFYSPKVVPELWSRESLTLLRSHLGEKSTALYTYSAATPVRLNLLLAGFFVGEGVPTGIKGASTTAHTRLGELGAPLSKSWLAKLSTSASIRDVPEKEDVRSHPQWDALDS